MTDNERFGRWLSGELLDAGITKGQMSAHTFAWTRAAYMAASESERARARKLCDRLEAELTAPSHLSSSAQVLRCKDRKHTCTREGTSE